MNAVSSVQVSIGATEAHSRFADLLKRAHRGREHLIIEKGGIAKAGLKA